MIFYVGNTDLEWYRFLSTKSPEDINFWQPSGRVRFHAIGQGAPFLFRLKSPINKIAGVGFFSTHSLLPVDFAWEVFQERNGVDSPEKLRKTINKYRTIDNSLFVNPIIGCLVLSYPVFFHEKDWINTPADWSPNIVQGKTYDSDTEPGKTLWNKVAILLQTYKNHKISSEAEFEPNVETVAERYGMSLVKVRHGQGAFRVLITDTYNRRCAISGERTLPVLEAAHIKPFDKEGPHLVSNGLLLRSDIHKLFDAGYLTISDDYKIEVSRRIREEFENGRDYYKFHGQDLYTLPSKDFDRPGHSFLEWHHVNKYKG